MPALRTRSSHLRARSKSLTLNIGDCVSIVGCGSSVVGAPLRNLGKFVYPTVPVSFGGDTESRRSVLSGVYTMGSKRSHSGGKCVTGRGLHVLA